MVKAHLPRVFITHSSVDQELAEAVVRALRLGTGVPPNRIFCSSLDGMGIPTGARFAEYIQAQLASTSLVVPLISPAYLDSLFCMWELGAAWVLDARLHPVAVDEISLGDLPTLLSGIQAGKFNRTGLNGLAKAVAKATGTNVETDLWEPERDRIIAELPETFERLRSDWRRTPAARERRRARVADCAEHTHASMHALRDADYLAVDAESHGVQPNRSAFLAHLRTAAQAMARTLSTSTGVQCRVTIKQLIVDESTKVIQVADLTRSSGRNSSRLDLVTENSDFENLVQGDVDWFMSNDLESARAAGTYKNSHAVPNQQLTYASTIVWPIRKVLDDPLTASVVGAILDWADLIGFLCVDSKSPDAFDEIDVELGAAFADTLYSTLRPYLLGRYR